MDINTIKESILSNVLDSTYHPFLSVVENKDKSISIWAKTALIAKIKLTRNGGSIEVKNKYIEMFPKERISKKNDVLSVVEIHNISDVTEWSYVLSELYMTILAEMGTARFGCCSRYEDCSNAKECLHPDKTIAAACAYKKNLESGRIFYGRNKNV